MFMRDTSWSFLACWSKAGVFIQQVKVRWWEVIRSEQA